MALNKNIKAFILHVTFFNLNLMTIHQVQEASIVLLVIKKVEILFKYSNYSDVFLEKKTLILLEITDVNQYVIKFQKN